MANKEISELNPVSFPLTGNEEMHLVQGGNSRKASVKDITTPLFDYSLATNLIYPYANSTTLTSLGVAATASGSAAEAMGSGDYLSKFRRIRVTASGTNAFGQLRENGSASVMANGFRAWVRFGVKTTVANGRFLAGVNGGWSGSIEISASLNIICVGKDSADTNLHIIHNDNAGVATKIDLGANFPANTSSTDVYDAMFYVHAGGLSFDYFVRRLNTGDVASGTVNTDLPISTQVFNAGLWMGTGSTGGSHIGCCMFIQSQQLVPTP